MVRVEAWWGLKNGYGCSDFKAMLGFCKQADHDFYWEEETPTAGPYSTESGYFYVGGFTTYPWDRNQNQDAYIVYPANKTSFPLVAFAHGCCKMSPNDTAGDYRALFQALASNGIATVSFATCLWSCPSSETSPSWKLFSEHQRHLLHSLRTNKDLHPALKNVNFSSLGLMGHSEGGLSSLQSATFVDPNVRAVASISGETGSASIAQLDITKVSVPVFYMVAQFDNPRCMYESQKKLYDQTPPRLQGKSVLAELRHAKHLEIQKDPPGGRWNFYILSFLQCHLLESREACCYMNGDESFKYAICNRYMFTKCNNSFPSQEMPGCSAVDMEPEPTGAPQHRQHIIPPIVIRSFLPSLKVVCFLVAILPLLRCIKSRSAKVSAEAGKPLLIEY